MKQKFLPLSLLGVLAILMPWVCLAAEEVKPPAQTPVSARAEVSKASFTIGEPVTLKVTIVYPKNVEILSSIEEPAAAGLELKNPAQWKAREGKKEVLAGSWSVTGFQLGRYLIEPLEIQYRIRGGEVQKAATNPVYLTIESVAAGEEKKDIRDVKGVVKVPSEWKKYLLPVGIPLVLVGLLLVYLLYVRKRDLLRAALKPRQTPIEEALQNLHELFDSSLIRDGLVKAYYFRLSEILKIFIEKQFGIQAAEATTSELGLLLKRVDVPAELKLHLLRVLESADFAKFAKWIPAPADILALNQQAEEVVRKLAAPAHNAAETAENQNAVS